MVNTRQDFLERKRKYQKVQTEIKQPITKTINRKMKKVIFTAALFCAINYVSKAQTVNDIPLKDINVEYVQIVGTSKLFSNKVTIEIDFGQENKLFSSDKDTRIKDINGKNMVFNSMIDALNFMSANGYEFVQAYVLAKDNQTAYHYLLRKRKQQSF